MEPALPTDREGILPKSPSEQQLKQIEDEGLLAPIIDILAHEYGWTIREILETPKEQIFRMIQALSQRKERKAEAIRKAASGGRRGKEFDLDSDSGDPFLQARLSGFPIKDH